MPRVSVRLPAWLRLKLFNAAFGSGVSANSVAVEALRSAVSSCSDSLLYFDRLASGRTEVLHFTIPGDLLEQARACGERLGLTVNSLLVASLAAHLQQARYTAQAYTTAVYVVCGKCRSILYIYALSPNTTLKHAGPPGTRRLKRLATKGYPHCECPHCGAKLGKPKLRFITLDEFKEKCRVEEGKVVCL